MKTTQKGFIIPLIIIILAVLAIGGGAYAYHEKKMNDALVASSTAQTSLNTPDMLGAAQNNNQVNTNANLSVPAVSVNTNASVSSYTLTESEILNATYRISAYSRKAADGKAPAQNIIFPSHTYNNDSLTNNVYITENGTVSTDSIVATGEGFWINAYKYTDSSRTEAKVFITGNFGASGYDDREFIVDKTNGNVTTREVPCVNKTQNGSCNINAN